LLDASALLTLFNREPGYQKVAGLLEDSSISAVNLAEVASKLTDAGLSAASIRSTLQAMRLKVIPFDEETAYGVAAMRPLTRKAGLSLGDRACLSTSLALGAIAVTADRSWAAVRSGVKVQMLR
jgi:PIN domain nuclease of toxin-antitoxin system